MPHFLEIVITLVLGLAFGSFATALSWRIPRGLPWAGKGEDKTSARSRCPSCRHVLSAIDLVPLFSWLLQKGRCRHCGAAIGWRYPFIELITLAGCIGAYLVWGLTLPALVIMISIPFLVALLIIDTEHMILPNQLVFILFCLGIVFTALLLPYAQGPVAIQLYVLNALGGFFVFGLLLWFTGFATGLALKKESLGFGDVKFAAVAGLWLGAAYLPLFLIGAGLLGILWGLFHRIVYKQALFPFGPAIILTFYIGLILKGAGIGPLLI